MNPTISVALCTYNGGRFLQAQLTSIFEQVLPVSEVIICDDSSKDDTISIIKDFMVRYPGIIHFHRQEENKGTITNFGKAISLCTGDFIFLSDQDDTWLPDKTRDYVDYFIHHEDALLLFSNADLIDESGNVFEEKLWDRWGFNEKTRQEWADNKVAYEALKANNNKATGATVAFRKCLRDKALPFVVKKDFWHDTWLALVAASLNGLAFLEKSYLLYRIHPEQQIGIRENEIMEVPRRGSQNYSEEAVTLQNLYFEKRLGQLMPEAEKDTERMCRIEEEICFLTKRQNYPANFFLRGVKVISPRQMKRYIRFTTAPYYTMITDLLKKK